MIPLIKEYKIYIISGLIGCIAAIYFIFQPVEESGEVFEENEWLLTSEDNDDESLENILMTEIVLVDVKGAVKNPGVYEATGNDRVIDLITKAGGLNENADETQINFALRVEDEMVIYVPKIGEISESAAGEPPAGVGNIGAGQEKNDGKVNLNTANESELQTLPGIGPAKASAIIEYRETNGPYKVIEDLKSISGIGEKTFEKLKDSIKVK
ncbi:helix-hairpin-helix domain-containing protein [Bacillus sp. S/N-304-OC-R1]|uniref:helix-hairpin-helix domain-containing protein n=1 Tax=Bacillus sp. S/N-304-OC-R1 TaxID=2758034 RepID=UPI001C8EF1B7|nr:helix-hairpin-helix domain-containing protein [Bacillus sp. S/N-304-OC-R1]MBY0123859.1 helix-hairpin-helix domain-containing protein [Bacillus sp. S/N-304-OC-R1]